MKQRLSLVTQVGIASGAFFLIFGIVLTKLVSDFVARNFQAQTEKSISEFLEKQVDNYLNPEDFEHRTRTEEEINSEHQVFGPFLSAITTNEVIKIRIWDDNATIIHAQVGVQGQIDFEDVNRQFPDNKEYLSAMEGIINTQISGSDSQEDVGLSQYRQFMEIYVPVYLEGRETPVGVAEVYYKLDTLNKNIANIKRNIFIFTSATFVLLYGILLLITKRASDTLITQSKKIEEAQRKEVEKTKELLRLKDDFFFIATHDLKTPVVAIKGFVDLIEDRVKDLPGDIRESIDAIKEASDRLTNLVSDLLEVARSESGTIKVETAPVELTSILDKTIKEVSPKAKEKNIKINRSLEKEKFVVLADEDKLAEVFENLLSNAVKYNKDGGKVNISTRQIANYLEIKFSDSGYGIPKKEQGSVFTKFFRSEDPQVRKVSGTGLGLFVVSMLIKKMGGEITFASQEGIGSTFTVKLRTP